MLANLSFAASYVVLLGASATTLAVGVVVVLVGSAIYTVGELTGGPVTAALAAEASPEHLRGRYFSLVQLAWNLASTVAPVAFAWLLDRGATPLWIALLNEFYAGQARIDPRDVMRQVFIAQLLPLGIGIALRHFASTLAGRVEPAIRRAGTVLLVVAVILVLAELWRPLYEAGVATIAAMVFTTAAALAVGHLLGGPAPTTRTAVAVTSAARNPGLALLVATVNAAQPAIIATVLAYVLVSLLAITPYVAWRHRAARRAAAYGSPPGRAAR